MTETKLKLITIRNYLKRINNLTLDIEKQDPILKDQMRWIAAYCRNSDNEVDVSLEKLKKRG